MLLRSAVSLIERERPSFQCSVLALSFEARRKIMGLGSLFAKIEAFVKGAEVVVSADFVKVFGATASKNFAVASMSLLKTAEGKIVTDAVSAAEALDPTATGAQKFSTALTSATADLKTQGVSVGNFTTAA